MRGLGLDAGQPGRQITAVSDLRLTARDLLPGPRQGDIIDEGQLERLAGDAQLIAIAGANGRGKTTLMDNLHPLC